MGPSGEGALLQRELVDRSVIRSPSDNRQLVNTSWLRPGEVLIHIGPHKTGTTALQSSLAVARTEVANAGVFYPGPNYSHYRASTQQGRGRRSSGPEWLQLVAAVRARSDRAVVSSEFFDQADYETARMVIDQLGGPDTRVLITLRPLRKILPGLWQQHVKNGSTKSLDVWLSGILNEDRSHPSWDSLDQSRLVARWADAVGRERLAVLVVDANSPDALLRSFEELVGLPPRLLHQQDSNRSLTAPEAELIRTLNGESTLLRNDPDLRRRWIRFGAIKHLVEHRRPGSGEARLTLPQWAAAEVRADQSRIIDEIGRLGVHVVGDLNSLASSAHADFRETPASGPTDDLPIDLRDSRDVVANHVAIDLLVGLTQKADGARRRLQGEMQRERIAKRAAEREADSGRLDQVTGRQLLGELVRRSRRRAARLLRHS